MLVRIFKVEEVARRVKALSLAPANGRALPDFAPGSHVKIRVPHLSGRRSPFSLTNPSWEANRYQIVVLHKQFSGAVTRWLHDHPAPGDVLDISEPRCGLGLVPSAARHCLVAGGSGITAFLSHLEALRKDERDYELHYALRSRAEMIYCDALSARHGLRFKQYVSAEGVRLRVDDLLLAQTPGTHVYVCGPRRLIQSVVDAARAVRFPPRAIHWDTYGWQPHMGVDEYNKNDSRPLCSRRTDAGKAARIAVYQQPARPVPEPRSSAGTSASCDTVKGEAQYNSQIQMRSNQDGT